MGLVADRKTLTLSVFSISTSSMTRWLILFDANEYLAQYLLIYWPYYNQVFLLLWWWFYLIALLSLLRVLYRAVQCRRVKNIDFIEWVIIYNLLVTCFHDCISSELMSSRSAWLRFKLLDLRLHRYFKRSSKIDLIRNYIYACKLGDW